MINRKLINRPSLTVDPGITVTGIALWSSLRPRHPDDLLWTNEAKPTGLTIEDRLEKLYRWIYKIISDYRVRNLVIEWPQAFNASKGRASHYSGDYTKLCASASIVVAAGFARGCKVRLVEPFKWKGNLNKEQTRRWVETEMLHDFDGVSSHRIDAVGLGLYVKDLI